MDSEKPLPVPGTPPQAEQASAAFLRLVEVVARLRAPDGCPWDREQTLATIRPHTLEETYEVLEAIDAGDDALLVEELGDLLLQVVLYAQIAADEGKFDLIPVLEGITEKLIRRHPHVFGDEAAHTAEQVLQNWERVKQQEKQRESALSGVPRALPALARTARLASKAARAGLEAVPTGELIDRIQGQLSILRPESAENKAERPGDAAAFGSILFQVATLARQSGVNPEDALREYNLRFEQAFAAVEQQLREEGRDIRDVGSAEIRTRLAVNGFSP